MSWSGGPEASASGTPGKGEDAPGARADEGDDLDMVTIRMPTAQDEEQEEDAAWRADPLELTITTWRGQTAWRIAGPDLEVVVTRCGGHLAAIRLPGEELNPLWQPHWAAADPATVRPGGAYGGIEASLLATIVGHSVCIDRFGPPRPGEHRPVHGEAGVVDWMLTRISPAEIEITALLPEARLHVRTRFAICGETLLLTRGVRHDDLTPRELEWCEHVSLGAPFIDDAEVEAGIDRVHPWPGAGEPGSRFSAADEAAGIPCAAALAMPRPDAPPCGDVLAGHVVEGWWSLTNQAWKRRLTYSWSPDDFPWLTLWTQHRSRAGTPWDGVERARGMELTTKPFPDGASPPDRHPSFHGTSTTCFVPPWEWREHELMITWEEI